VSALWNGILDGLGQILAFLYQLIPNYGVAIILLTLLIRLVLLPLGIKQVRSMQAMQAVQPKVKELQKKYKSDKQKLNEETMKLYREHGVNPLSGCLPLLAQLPVLIALFAVLRVTGGNISTHIPRDSELFTAIQTQDTYLLPGHQVNLLCTATQAGQVVTFTVPPGQQGNYVNPPLDCGSNIPDRIPYYLLAAAMIGTTFWQQRQMQRASPAGSQQQQAITRIMPLLFGIWGFLFPAGLVLYWTTTNAFQIGQQSVMLRRGMIGAAAAAAKDTGGGSGDGQAKRGGTPPKPSSGGTTGRGGSGGGGGRTGEGSTGSRPSKGTPTADQRNGGQGASGRRPSQGSGGTRGGDRKKRRKR
jgi:YidC/Oxa1 family membrane protein insertase